MSKRARDEAEAGLASLKYGEAKERLETIIDELEHREVDVDDLAAKVKEAAALIRVLNDKLTQTEAEVQRVLKEVRPAEGTNAVPAAPRNTARDEGPVAEERRDDDVPF